MTIRVRPHHLLCLLTYAGKGYSSAFTANYDVIAERISRGEEILIVEGPDDICAPLLDQSDPHCWRESVTVRDRLAAGELGELLPGSIEAGTRMSFGPDTMKKMREAFRARRIRAACLGCEWNQLCSSIAADGYKGTRLSAPGLHRPR